jgi:hypothetical protein
LGDNVLLRQKICMLYSTSGRTKACDTKYAFCYRAIYSSSNPELFSSSVLSYDDVAAVNWSCDRNLSSSARFLTPDWEDHRLCDSESASLDPAWNVRHGRRKGKRRGT